MNGLFKFFSTGRRLLLVTSLALTAAVGSWVGSSNALLKTEEAPCKIISLELTADSGKANDIIRSWRDAHVLDVAQVSIYQDYAFIFTYVLCAIFFVMAYDREPVIKWRTIIFSYLALIAGAADVIENLFTTSLIQGASQSQLLIFIPAIVKWGLLIVIVVYVLTEFIRHNLKTRWQWSELTGIGNLLKSAKMYMPGLITVLISYFVFIKLPQGQDVIMQIVEYPGPFFWTTAICVPIWCLFCWYSSRLVGYEKSLAQAANGIPEDFHTHFPRLIAYNSLVSIQAAIFALPTIGNLSQGAVWAIIIILNSLYFFRHKILTMDPAPVGYRFVSGVIIGAYGVLAASLVIWGKDSHVKLLAIAAYALFITQLVVMYLFVRRRRRLAPITKSTSDTPVGHLRFFRWNIVRVPLDVQSSEQNLFKWMFIIAIGGILLYTIVPFFPGIANVMGPLAIVTLSFGALIVLSNVVTILSIHIRINVFVVLLIWAIVVGNIFNPYDVATVKLDKDRKVIQRPDMQTYVQRWLRKRKDMIAASKEFPVYLVIADGGASRSGYWVSSVLSAIQEQTDSIDHNNTFAEHLLVLAGASGGSVGNATFYSLLKNDLSGDVTYLESSRKFLREDFLSPVLSRWFSSDLLQHITPWFPDDRAAVLASAMESFGEGPLEDVFSKRFSEAIDTTGCLPILFINTTNVQEGEPAVVSSVDITSISERIDVLKLIASTDTLRPDINFSTGVVMGARFPYVSPAGNIGNKSFVDGGYFDNTGAGILHEMMQDLTRRMDKDSVYITGNKEIDTVLLGKLKFQLIYLSNSSLGSKESGVMHPLVNDVAAPIITVLGTYGSQTHVNNTRLKNFMMARDPKIRSVDVNLFRSADEPDLPMNWVISDFNLGRMNDNLKEAMKHDIPKMLKIQALPDSVKCNCRQR
ncbi:MAG TPA: patatin-like phospholipase family protein [Cyclobacteriaceae bacterium]|nr:patatin-like phospholipase family protein [Cyclobacteriaceae bacterium]